ncbi:hypothetical protein [Nocardia amamiensis]|uniref:hypothetical protein n=1 Tax=Nocardia TaxID=1817 RepID=UPI0033F9CE78
MTKISRIVILAKMEWTSIQVPSGSELVWAGPGGLGMPGPADPSDVITTYWRSDDLFFGEERCLIRTASLPGPPSPGGEEPGSVQSGVQGAIPFINDDFFLWWKKSQFDAYPPNSTSTE